MNTSELRKQLYETCLSAGLKVISDDKCCQLLAWLYIYGGENEQTVFDGRLNTALLYAQKRLNIGGGEIPNIELLPVLQKYVKSIADYYNPPEWVWDLEKEYGIQNHHKKLFGAEKK